MLFALSNSILADKYLLVAKKHIKAKEYKKAVDSFEKIFGLGVSVPNDIYYFYAKTLQNNDELTKALKNFNLYIEKTGRNSQHYQEALEHIIDIEKSIEDKEKKEYYAKYIIEDDGLLIQSFQNRKNEPNRYMKWQEAKLYCKNLDLNGKGWRLPSISEISHITNIKVYKTYSGDVGYKIGWKKWTSWFKKNYYKRIRNPQKKPNIYKKNEYDNDNYYIFMKEKFLINVSLENTNTSRIFAIWTNKSHDYKGAFRVHFSSGRIHTDFKSNTNLAMCVKDKY